MPQKSIAPEPTQIPQEGEPLQSKGIVIKMTEEYMEKFNKLNLPDDLKILTYEQCRRLCGEIRDTLIKTVSENGGHLSSNLGAVELTLALHRVFSSPKDKFVWDVGHQSYTHKILTGRLKDFPTLRKENGLSGFCKPEESIHDAFISGHSSNSVSAALGIAEAMKMNGDNHHAVAILGDGAATGGLSFEGLNNAGKSNTNLIVVLNYNEMSISKNVGAFAKYLSNFRTKDSYKKTKTIVERALDNIPVIGQPIKETLKFSKDTVKNSIFRTTIFEDLGFEFVGPVNGHNLKELEEALHVAKSMHKPVVVQVNTIKGKGYAPAEENPGEYHGVSSFELKTGNPDICKSDSFSTVFGDELSRLADNDERICAITAAMKYGTGLDKFAKSHRNRFFDVGIAEGHALTFAGGLASMGKIPVFAVYSSFLQRGYDEIIHDLAISKAHAVIGVDRAGIVGEDGITHQGIFDVSFLSSIPGITIYSPGNYSELKACISKGIYEDEGIIAIRYPRGKEKECVLKKYTVSTDYEIYNNNSKTLVITYGRLFNEVSAAYEKLLDNDKTIDVLKLINLNSIDESLIEKIKSYQNVYFFEESYYNGSVSQKLNNYISNMSCKAIYNFVPQASVASSLEHLDLSGEQIYRKLNSEI